MLYQFKAVKNNNTVIRKIEADSENTVLNYLKQNNYIPIEIKLLNQNKLGFMDAFNNRLSFTEITDFTRQLAIMLNAGLTIVESLDILKKQTKNTGLLKVLNEIDAHIKSGGTFSSALKKYPSNFSNLYIALVKSGEASGKLSEILLKLAENLEKQREFRAKLKGALTYPALIVAAMFVVMFIMITFVLPSLLNLYKDFNVDLPLSTKLLMTASTFSANYWPFIVIGIIALVIFMKKYFDSPAGKLQLDKTMLKLPVISHVVEVSSLVDATRTLAILFGSGVSILESLGIVIETTGNLVFQNSFKKVYKMVEKGVSLGSALNQELIYPPILVQMVIVGEQTGHLDDTLMRLSKYFEMESDMAVKTMTTLIEPAILLVLGVGVGGLVMSVITPIYNLTTSLK